MPRSLSVAATRRKELRFDLDSISFVLRDTDGIDPSVSGVVEVDNSCQVNIN